MALEVFERDLSGVPADELVRYGSSAVVVVDHRGLDVFGAESADVIPEAHATAGVTYGRIVEILDLQFELRPPRHVPLDAITAGKRWHSRGSSCEKDNGRHDCEVGFRI